MKLGEYIKCPHCDSTLQLTESEQLSRSFVCPGCNEKISLSSGEATLREIGSYFKESDVFVTAHGTNEIRVLLDAGEDLIAQYNGEVVAREPVRKSLFSDVYLLEFKARELGHDVPYRAEINILRGEAYSMICSIYRKNKRIYRSESKQSKFVGYLLLTALLFWLIIYLVS